MEWIKIKEILDEQYPKDGALMDDVIGELIPVTKEVKTILVTLDVTLDSIAQANEIGAQVIISHHPFWWGDKEKAFLKNKYLKGIYDLLIKSEIGLYTAHTNADFAPNSLAYMQALSIDMVDIDQNDQNLSVTGYLKEETTVKDLSDLFKKILGLEQVEFRTNLGPNEIVKKITIATGTAGEYGIRHDDFEALHVIGEVKHHEWVQANQLGIKVFELSHFSETIFKHMVKILLDDQDVKVILSKEENGYKII